MAADIINMLSEKLFKINPCSTSDNHPDYALVEDYYQSRILRRGVRNELL